MWKAIQQLRAAGYISIIGWTLIARAISAKTGRMTLAMATFEVNSVRVWQTMQTKRRRTIGCNSWNTINDDPSIRDIPDALPPSARANPPPSRKTSDLKIGKVLNHLRSLTNWISPWCLWVDVLPGEKRPTRSCWEWLGRRASEESEASPVCWYHKEQNNDEDCWSCILDLTKRDSHINSRPERNFTMHLHTDSKKLRPSRHEAGSAEKEQEHSG